MTIPAFPVPLDNLISYVKARQAAGSPLGELAEAVDLAERLDEQSDALIGHFVDQARRSGASWSQIGASIGVSKQAAQKRFVPRWSDVIPEDQLFSRFTPRARNVVAAARSIVGDAPVPAAALVVGLLSEAEGLAARALHDNRITDDALSTAFDLAPATSIGDADPIALRRIDFDDSAKEMLRGTLKSVLRLGHNYVGTEHLLLGALFAGGPVAEKLGELGLTIERVEADVTAELERVKRRLRDVN
jgi:hypothetical protein